MAYSDFLHTIQTRAYNGMHPTLAANSSGRPTPRQSEIDIGKILPSEAREQVSFKDGKEVPYGTKGSVRPDWCIGMVCSIEVKNYDIYLNSKNLVDSIVQQSINRSIHLPKGMEQKIIIDIRGQSTSVRQLINIRKDITEKSNGIIKLNNIEFKTR